MCQLASLFPIAHGPSDVATTAAQGDTATALLRARSRSPSQQLSAYKPSPSSNTLSHGGMMPTPLTDIREE